LWYETSKAGDEAEAASITVASRVIKLKEVSRITKGDNKVKETNNSQTHKGSMAARKSTPPTPTQPSFSTTGTTVGLTAMMCQMDTPTQPVPIQHQDTCGMQLARIHAMAAGRDSTKLTGLDGEGRKRFH
jgi:hypothetical protein